MSMDEPKEITMWQVLENGQPLVSMSDLPKLAALYMESPATRTLQEIKCEGKGTWDVTHVFTESEAKKVLEYEELRKSYRRPRREPNG